ncbi:MAG TPA: serine/threonine-protein kinase [Myxococcaceae bacterium]|jgi:serine/threonine-protein kinase
MSGPEQEPKAEPPPEAPAAEWGAPTVVRSGSAQEPVAAEGPELPALMPGNTLAGRYTVLDKLGQGGMGVVVAAYDARLDRRVALKLLRRLERGEGEELEEAWLVREAQAMAKLSHPNVVAVYDAGTLEDGSIFIAMEYIQGQNLRRWRNQEPRAWRQVLEAYVAAGRGLAAAHAAGLIHRDFKADNVLVGQDGRVRVTDFGLARTQSAAESGGQAPALPRPSQEPVAPSRARASTDLMETARPSGSWTSAPTLPGLFMGTPAYMAPELFRGSPADLRTDLFAFCASLYEALFGQLPFKGSSPTDFTRAQLEGKVATPPEASEVPAWVTRTVLWGLQPEPARRPPSMEALLAALQKDPEVKRRMLLRRGTVGLTMVGLAALAVWGWTRQQTPVSDCASVQRQLDGVWDAGVKARVREAMLGSQLSYAPDTFSRVSTVLDDYAEGWVTQRREVCEFARQQAIQAQGLSVRREYCLERRRSQLRALTELLARAPDRELVPKAVQVAQSLPPLEYCADVKALTAAVPPPEDPALRVKAESLQQELDGLEALLDAGKYKDALARADTLLSQAGQVGHMPLHARALFLAALARDGTGDYKGAEDLARQASVLAARSKELVVAARASGLVLFLTGYRQARHQDATLLKLGVDMAVELVDDDLIRANAFNTQGILLSVQGRYEEARQQYERAVALREKVLGPEHPVVTPSLNNLGNVLEEMGRYEESRRMHERVLAIREKVLGPQHPDMASALGNLGNVLTSLGRYEEALAKHERALAVREQALGAEHPLVANTLTNLSDSLRTLGRYEESQRMIERALAIQEKALGAEHPRIAVTLYSFGLVLEGLGQYEQARQEYERTLAIQEKALGAEHGDLGDPLSGLGRLAEAQGRYEEARQKYERALALREKGLGAEHVQVANSLNELSSVLTVLKRYEEAERLSARARAVMEKALGPGHPELADSLLVAGRLRLARGKPEEAVPLLEQALAISSPQLRARSQFSLAQALWAVGKERPRAVALATQAREYWQGLGHPGLSEASRWLTAHASR